MNLDALTLGAVCDELRATVLGGRVQHVHLPDELGLALELYAQGRARWLYCSAHPQHARLHLVSERPPRTSDAVSPLLLLLRKYVDGARLDAVEQPPLERIVRLRFSRRAPSGELWRTGLVVEVMGRHSNLILVAEDGAVMDAAKRITPAMSRVRVVLPQRRYELPPAQDKLDPRELRAGDLAEAAEDYAPDRRLRDLLVGEVNACSPLLAREAVFRVHGDPDATVSQGGWHQLAEVFATWWADAAAGRWAPTAAFGGHDGERMERMIAYAAYPLRSFDDVRAVASICRAIETWYGQTVVAVDTQEARKAPLRQALEAARDRLRGKRYSLQHSLVGEAEVDRLRHAGEHLLAFGGELAPGQDTISVPGEAEPVRVDPSSSPVENAQRYFARYAKSKAAAREVPALIDAAEHELQYLAEALTHLDLAATPDEIMHLRSEWAELGYVSDRGGAKKATGKATGRGQGTPKGKASQGKPGKGSKEQARPGYQRVVLDGFEVLVGRSGKGNDTLLSREAHPADVWLHARGIPGGHVVIRSAGRPVPEAVLRRAASLAAAQSQARHAGSVAVDYTLRKYVARIKGAPPGLVTYRGERTIHVPPEP